MTRRCSLDERLHWITPGVAARCYYQLESMRVDDYLEMLESMDIPCGDIRSEIADSLSRLDSELNFSATVGDAAGMAMDAENEAGDSLFFHLILEPMHRLYEKEMEHHV